MKDKLYNIENNIYSNRFNHVYLYNEINPQTVLDIKLHIDELNLSQNINGIKIKPKTIILHINSPGGNVDSGIALMRIINKSRVPIIVYIEGMSASAATFITVTAKYRIISPYATMMIHQYFASITGQREKILFEANALEKLTNTMKNIYIKYTKLSKNKINNIMNNDIFFDANESLKYGLVDKILKPIDKKILNKYFKQNPEYILTSNILHKKTNFNNIYIYTEGLDNSEFFTTSFELIAGLQFILSVNPAYNNSLLSNGNPKPIMLHINDIGQFKNPYEILPLVNTILLSPIPIYSTIEGGSRDMGLLFSIVCYRRFIFKYAFITIDFIDLWEKKEKYKDVKQNTKLIRNMIKKLFKKYTKLPTNILDNLFEQRYVFTAENAIKYGICDEIID